MAWVLAVAWAGLVGWYALTAGPESALSDRSDPVALIVAAFVLALPLAVLWVAAAAARAARALRAESQGIRLELDALRQARDELTAGAARLQAALGTSETPCPAPAGTAATSAPPHRSPELAQPAKPPSPAMVVRALDFPDGEADAEGFRILRRAMAHPGTAALVTAARDVMAALAQDGIYMDDLAAGSADPALWRAFAAGARGAEVAALADVRDRSSLALASARLRDAPEFRRMVDRFLDRFAETFAAFAAEASEVEIAAFAETRTARAFMVCARVTGALGRPDA